MIKINGSYVSGATQFKLSGAYSAVTQYIKSGGVYVGLGGSQEKLRVATGLNLLPSARATKGYTNAFFRFPLEIVGGNKKYLVAGFNNFYRTTDTNSPIVSTGNSLTIVRAAIESTTTAAYMPITFNGGSESITLPELATAILSDEIHPDGLGLESFSNLSKYWVRIEARIPTASGFWPLNTPNYNYTGQKISYYDPAATTLVNGAYSTGALTTSGVAPSNGSTGVCPIWLGEPVDALQDKSFVVMGSSVEWGVSDGERWNIGGASGMGYINRALRTAECPNLNLAIPGATTMTLELYGQHITPWLKYGRYMFDGIGSNDIAGLRSAAEINAALEARYVQLGEVGYKKMIRNSLGMRTTSTDSWSTAANQTYYDNWGPGSKADAVKQFIDAGVANGLYDYITSTPSYRDAGDPWKWATNGTANYPTSDGTHPKSPMHSVMATDILPTIQAAISA